MRGEHLFAINPQNVETWKMKMRPMFGRVMTELARERRDVVLVLADSGQACRVGGFKDQPDQYVDCGIAEQNMIGVAAGLARCGKRPVAFAFAPFASERCFEQIRVDLAYSKLGVVVVGSEGGVGMGTQGVTHFGWEDVAAMRSLPNMTVLCPADNAELVKCLMAAIDLGGPVYLRLNGGVPKPVYREDYEFRVGKGILHKRGVDINIVATGTPVSMALEAAQNLASEGISCGVVDMHTIKPLDEDLVLDLARSTPCLLTIEEHSLVNGLGTAIADVLATSGAGCRLVKMGLPDHYPSTVSPYSEMMREYGLTLDNLVATVRRAVKEAAFGESVARA